MSRPVMLLLILLLAGCTGTIVSQAGSKAPAAAAPLVHLPRDQAAHPASQNEWWYVVGHLMAAGRSFGYEVTAFRFHHVHVPGASGTVDLYRTDTAITDETGQRFFHRITYYFPQSASVSSSTLDVRVGDVSLHGDSPENMTLQAAFGKDKIDLHLASRRRAMDVGGRGYLSFGRGWTYYYSLTDLQSSGELLVGGRRYAVTGTSWLDHQWGNWSWSTIQGWTWMALQLNNGVQLSLFDFHSASSPFKLVSALLVHGSFRSTSALTITPLGRWQSPHTLATYPSGWSVRIPSLRAVLTVTPSVLDQEMVDPADRRASYWEGSGRVRGIFQGRQVHGKSYTELTGFAR